MTPRKPTPVPGSDLPVIDESLDVSDAAKAIFADQIIGSTNADGIYIDSAGAPLPLIARLAKIKDSLPDVNPEGENDHFHYKFIKNTQVLGLLRPRLARQLIMIFPLFVEEREPVALKTKRGGDSLMTRITVTWQVVDGVTGESFTGQSVGYGDDSGDKGANKAYTAAQKNFLLRVFEIGGDRDIEEDTETDRRAGAREAGSERVGRVEVGDAPEIVGIQRGGRSDVATDAQVARVGQYVRDIGMTPEGFASFVDRVLGDNLELGDEPWQSIKVYLDSRDGDDIGKLLQRLNEILEDGGANSGSAA